MKPPSRLSILMRIRRLRLLANDYHCTAAEMVGVILQIWCEQEFPLLPKPKISLCEALLCHKDVHAFVDIIRRLSFLDSTYWVSSVYALLVKESYQKSLAMYFTPASLTEGLLDDLTEQGIDFGVNKFMDPACGGAAFLTPIALRMCKSLRENGMTSRDLLSHIENHIFGTDLDQTLCELSKHFLCMALYDDITQANFIPNFSIRKADSLIDLSGWIGNVDVVVCNPPYRKMRADELEPLKHIYAEVIEAQPNLYCLFMALSVRLLRLGGYAALVTPTSFLSGQYFRPLRKFLMNHADIAHIGMVNDREGVFVDVQQETALTVLKRRAMARHDHLTAAVSVVSASGQYKSVGVCRLPNEGAVWPIPRAVKDVVLLKSMEDSKATLESYGYRARIGAYVWNRDKRPKFKSLQEASDMKAVSALPILWSSDISPNKNIGITCIKKVTSEARFIDVGRKASSVIENPCVVIQRVTSNDQPKRLVAAYVSQGLINRYGGFVGENHIVIVEKISDAPKVSPSKLAKILNSKYVDRYFRCISGATNVSAFELKQLILPDPCLLVEAMRLDISVDDAVARAYGLEKELDGCVDSIKVEEPACSDVG